jgi:hypothetical protein
MPSSKTAVHHRHANERAEGLGETVVVPAGPRLHYLRHVRSILAVSRATIASVPRPLTDRERDILDLLLAVDFPGAAELRQQAASVSAEREGMIIDLIVSAESLPATVISRTPVQADVDGDGYDGGLLLFVDDGRLSALEYWWVTEEQPDLMPPRTAIGAPITSK